MDRNQLNAMTYASIAGRLWAQAENMRGIIKDAFPLIDEKLYLNDRMDYVNVNYDHIDGEFSEYFAQIMSEMEQEELDRRAEDPADDKWVKPEESQDDIHRRESEPGRR